MPVLAADLSFTRVTGVAYGNLLHWAEDVDPWVPPVVGQRVMAADGSDRVEAVITEVRDDVIKLAVSQPS